MLVSHRYRFIFTKTMKTAGTSVESYFERFCMPEGEWAQSHLRDEYESPAGIIGYRGRAVPEDAQWWHHLPAATIRDQLGLEAWDSYFKFCTVRNPFDRCISAFSFVDNTPGVDSEDPAAWEENLPSLQRRFCEYLQTGAHVDRAAYLIDDTFCLDDIIRYESLDSDLERICARIGVPFEAGCLPTFKSEHRDRRATIEAMYTDESRAIVESRFAFELAHFGYRFPVA